MILFAALLLAQPAPANHAAAKRLLHRAGMCQHWAGEVDGGPGVDKARQREIQKGMDRDRCGDELDHDLKAFLKGRPAPADARAVKRALAELG